MGIMNNPLLWDQCPWLLLFLMLGKENCESLTWKWDFHFNIWFIQLNCNYYVLLYSTRIISPVHHTAKHNGISISVLKSQDTKNCPTSHENTKWVKMAKGKLIHNDVFLQIIPSL